jgi:phosphomannomutase
MTFSSQKKLLIFDLYGTLAENNQPVSAEIGELIAELLQKMPVAIVSGAAFAQFEKHLIPALPETAHFAHLYLLPTNGAQCYSYKGTAWHKQYDRSFNTFERARIMQALKEALEETGFSRAVSQIWGEQIEDRGAQITFSALGSGSVRRAQNMGPDRGQAPAAVPSAAKAAPGFFYHYERLYFYRHHPKGRHQSLRHPPTSTTNRHLGIRNAVCRRCA